MMVMTAKLNLKKILLILAAAAAVVLSLILLLGGNGEAETTAAPAVSGNDARVQFLTEQGWEVNETPTESSRVKVPGQTSQIYERYNNLQKSQGYDLSKYAGKKVMRYVYEIRNYPGTTAPVYATLLVYKDQIIGGDITDTGANGKIRGFQRPKAEKTAQKSALPAPTQAPAEAPTEGTSPAVQQ